MADQKQTGKRYDRNRQAILDAASRIIAEQGIEALSIRNLAVEAEYSPSTLYRYFQDKEEILDTLAAQAWQMSAEQTQSKPKGESTLDAIMQSGMGMYEFACQHPIEYKLMISSTSSSPKSMQAFMDDEKFAGVRTLLDESVNSGSMILPIGYTIDLLALQLWFIIHGAAMMRIGMMQPFGEDVDQWMDQLSSAIKMQLSTCNGMENK